jgi:uncharacterized HAD superfamily protein
MPKPVIAMDIDDVLAGTTDVIRQFVNNQTGSQLTPEDYLVPGNYHQYYESVWETHHIANKVKYEDFAQEMIRDQSQIPLLPGAQAAIHRLSDKFHIVFITYRKSTWEKATRKWFKDYFLHDDIELYFTGQRDDKDYKTKGQLCKALGAELLIDDNYDHCISAVHEGIKTVLFGEYGWSVNAPKELVRCKDWQAVVEYLSHAG